MRRWMQTSAQPEYHQLCACMLRLARVAAGRFTSRETAAAPVGRMLQARATGPTFAECAAELRAAWIAAELLVPGGGPLGRLGRLIRTSADFVEPILLALAAAPLLDRGVAQLYAQLTRDTTVGWILDLAAQSDEHRMALFGALHPDAPLRRTGVLLTDDPALGITAASPLTVAPSVLALLRCEPVPLPWGVVELDPIPPATVTTPLLAALELYPLQPGEVVSIDGEAHQCDALARLLAGAEGSLVWRHDLDAHPEPGWQGLLRDAALANAICLVTSTSTGPWGQRLRWVVDRTMASVVCAILWPSGDFAALYARADREDIRALATEPITQQLLAALVS